jgi:glycerophosphoryl diester phosphodiesterase
VIEVRRRAGGPPLRIGHKGAAALAPENTLEALARAVEHGVDIVEFDVLDLQDGTLVLAHSNDLHEVSHGAARGRVRQHPLAELKRLAPALPTLDEALAFLSDRAPKTGIQVDVKCVDAERRIVDALRSHGAVERTLVSSVSAHTLRTIAGIEPGLRLGLTYPFDRFSLSRHRPLAPVTLAAVLALRQALPARIGRWLERARATVATLNYLVVSRAAVEQCHAREAAVFAWTVDSRRALARLEADGVDGIITNDPGIFATTLTA